MFCSTFYVHVFNASVSLGQINQGSSKSKVMHASGLTGFTSVGVTLTHKNGLFVFDLSSFTHDHCGSSDYSVEMVKRSVCGRGLQLPSCSSLKQMM